MAEKETKKKQTGKAPSKTRKPEKQHETKKIGKAGKIMDPGEIRKDISQQEEEKEKSILKDILAISGQGGLFKFISQARNGIIVESLITGKRMHAFSSMKLNSLKDISIFTKGEEIPLEKVFRKISEKENGGQSIDFKSSQDDLKNYFKSILPEYDEDRVYVSDIKKIINWYNIMQGLDMLKFDKKEQDQS